MSKDGSNFTQIPKGSNVRVENNNDGRSGNSSNTISTATPEQTKKLLAAAKQQIAAAKNLVASAKKDPNTIRINNGVLQPQNDQGSPKQAQNQANRGE